MGQGWRVLGCVTESVPLCSQEAGWFESVKREAVGVRKW
jgi:hypothetical protein